MRKKEKYLGPRDERRLLGFISSIRLDMLR